MSKIFGLVVGWRTRFVPDSFEFSFRLMFLQFFIKYNQCVKIRNQVWFDVLNEFANFHPSHKHIRIWQLVVYIIAKTVCFNFVQHSIFFHQKILGTLLEDYQTCVYSSLQQLRNKVKMKKERKKERKKKRMERLPYGHW